MAHGPVRVDLRPASPSIRVILVLAALLHGCSAGMVGSTADVATEADWRALFAPRPAPLPNAPRVTIGDIGFVGSFPWPARAPVPASLGVAELVAAGLLRRQDVHFVERRRFSAAVVAERGGTRAAGAPRAGVSPGAELIASAVWLSLAPGEAAVELRISTLETGSVSGTTRVNVSAEADPVILARAIVGGLLEALDGMGRLPAWDDPATNASSAASPDAYAIQSFLRGLSAEERWDWEGARKGYQPAASDPSFFEARAALARVARLRRGGTLGES